jgi:hypothetical protein
MKTFSVSLMTAGLLGLLVGCDGSSDRLGGPGASEAQQKRVQVGTPDNAFKLSLPTLSTSIKQGERKTVTLGITRGKNFDQDVHLKLSDLPQGVSITPRKRIGFGQSSDKGDVRLPEQVERPARIAISNYY